MKPSSRKLLSRNIFKRNKKPEPQNFLYSENIGVYSIDSLSERMLGQTKASSNFIYFQNL